MSTPRRRARAGSSSRSARASSPTTDAASTRAAVAAWAAQIAELKHAGKDVVLVSSGAIAEGVKRLGWSRASVVDARAAGGGGGRPDGTRAGVRIGVREVRPAYGADPAHARRPRRSPPLSQRALDALHAARRSTSFRSSTRTTRSRPTRSASATTTRSARSSRISSRPTSSCCSPTSRDSIPRTRGAIRRQRSCAPRRRATAALEAMAGGAGSALGRGGMLSKVLAAKRAGALRRVDRHRRTAATRTC